jgi:hypothetical protein
MVRIELRCQGGLLVAGGGIAIGAPTRRAGSPTGRDLPRPAGRPVMTKTILVEAVARIGRPKNNWCLGRLGKAHGEALLGSPIVLKEAEALDQWRKRPDPPRLGKAGRGLPRRTRGEQGAS